MATRKSAKRTASRTAPKRKAAAAASTKIKRGGATEKVETSARQWVRRALESLSERLLATAGENDAAARTRRRQVEVALARLGERYEKLLSA